jgi:hypothetical protein
MLVTIQYFEKDRFVGSRSAERSWRPGQWITESRYWPNTVYFCGDCVKHGNGELLTGPVDFKGCDKSLLTRELLALIEGVESE